MMKTGTCVWLRMITDTNKFFTKYLKADTVMYNEDGSIVEEDEETFNMIQRWISKNVVNHMYKYDYKYVKDDRGVVTNVN